MRKTTAVAIACGMAMSQAALAQRGRGRGPSEMSEKVKQLASVELEKLAASGDYGAAQTALADLYDRTIHFAGDRELDAIVEADMPLRLVTQLARVDQQTRSKVLPVLRDEPELAWTLAMLVDPEHDDIQGVYRTLAELIEAHGAGMVAAFDNLSAALCVVHDRPYSMRVNENTATASPATDILRYFADHVREMDLDPRLTPADLLIYVADTTESPEQMAWALSEYRRSGNIGDRFFEIEYDEDYFEDPQKNPKKLTESGEFDLQAIKKYGGVCADQAYFAESVGKAKGVPTAYVTARGAEVGHAWVGFLEVRGKRASWNFNAGRYDAYQNIQGLVTDPQTGQQISDAQLGLSSQDATMDEAERREALAICGAAARLADQRRDGRYAAPTAAPEGVERPAKFEARTNSVEDQLELLEAGLKASPANVEGWGVLVEMAKRRELSVDQMDDWAKVIDRLCGSQYPDFMVETLEPMIASVEDTKEQSRMWGWLYGQLRARPDLASRVLMNQGDLMKKAGDPGAAWAAYTEVINRYTNNGTSVLGALWAAEQMVRQEKGGDQQTLKRDIVPLYERAWRAVSKPKTVRGTFVTQSNWYRIGMRLIDVYVEAGEDSKAKSISASLGSRRGGGGAFDD